MYICKKCNSELDEFKGKLICSNEACDFIILQSAYELQKSPRNKKICNDSVFWYQPAFDTYPSMIAHEYWRLYDMISKGQTFGALLQLKDVFEVLIKFPTLVVVSRIFHKKDRSDIESKIILSLLEKPLSLGDWKRIAQTIVTHVQTDDYIHQILTNIVSIYEDIPAWRNDYIGHGALTIDEEELTEDIEKKLKSIQCYLSDNEQLYQNLSLYIKDQHTSRKILIGQENARNLGEDFSEVFLSYDGEEQTLYPYIFVEEGKVFFFDSFSKFDYRASLLNYTEGVKRKNNKTINDVMKTIFTSYKQTDLQSKLQEHSFEDQSYSLIEEKVTQKMQEVDDFERPDYLKLWLEKNIKERSKGIFLLQMERGTGKTTFSRALDELSLGKIKLPDISVRCHYINDTYAYKLKNFFTNLIDQLRMDKHGNNVISSIHQISDKSENHKRALAQLLNNYHQEHQKYFGKEKLLVVIDGLDEIPAKSTPSIYDFIPTLDMLNENVYILLTSRTIEELSKHGRNRIQKLDITDMKISNKHDNEHLDILEQYVKKHVFNGNTLTKDQEKIKSWMLDHADFRFIYLKLLKEIYTMRSKDELASLPKGEELFDYYFNMLESLYGSKFYKNLVNLLSIIATSYEPLTYREISKLMGENKATFKLIAYLIDIRGFVNVERSYRGNLLSISHEDWKMIIIKKFKENMKQLVQTWEEEQYVSKELLSNIDWINEENDGVTYLITYMYDYLIGLETKKYSTLEVSNYYLDALKNPTLYESQTIYQLYRRYCIQAKYISILKPFSEKGTIAERLAEVLTQRGNTLHEMKVYDEANHDFTESIHIFRRLIEKGDLNKAVELADALSDRGTVLNLMEKIDDALVDYNEAIHLFESSLEKGEQVDQELSRTFLNRGTIYFKKKCYEAALKDFNDAIGYQKNSKVNDITKENFMAVILLNRASIFQELKRYEDALDDYDSAISLNRRLIESGKHYDESYFGVLLCNRGVVLNAMNKNKEALKSYDESIEIFRKLEEDGTSFDRNIFANALFNRGNILAEDGEIEEAIQTYTESIFIRKELEEEGLFFDWDNFAKVFVNRGNMLKNIQYYNEASNDFSEAIGIYNKLYESGKEEYESDLAEVLMNRGMTYFFLTENQNALDDLNKSLNLRKKQNNEMEIATVLHNRGSVYFQLHDVESAIDDFSKSVEMRKVLFHKGKLKNVSDLAEVLLNYGAACYDLGKHDKAISNYTESIEIWESIIDQGIEGKEYYLSLAFFNRGLTYQQQGLIKEALQDYNQYIHIQSRLLEEGKQIDINQFIDILIESGDMYWDDSSIIDAISNYNAAIHLLSQQDDTREYSDITKLINSRIKRANLLCAIQQEEEALKDYNASIDVVTSRNDLKNPNSAFALALLLFYRGSVNADLGNEENALVDFDKSIDILQHLSEQESPQVAALLEQVTKYRTDLINKKK